MTFDMFDRMLDKALFNLCSYVEDRFDNGVINSSFINYGFNNKVISFKNSDGDDIYVVFNLSPFTKEMVPVLRPYCDVGFVELSINRISDTLLKYSNKNFFNLVHTTYRHYIREDDGELNIIDYKHGGRDFFCHIHHDHVLDIVYFILDSLGLSNDFEKYLIEKNEHLEGEIVF